AALRNGLDRFGCFVTYLSAEDPLPDSEGGTLATSDPTTVCAGDHDGTITLSGNIGDVVRWDSSTDNFNLNIAPIANTTTVLTFNNRTETTSFRAVIQSGVSPEAFSTVVTITVVGASDGGTIAAGGPTDCIDAPGQIMLTGQTGAVVRWESSTDNFNLNVLAI